MRLFASYTSPSAIILHEGYLSNMTAAACRKNHSTETRCVSTKMLTNNPHHTIFTNTFWEFGKVSLTKIRTSTELCVCFLWKLKRINVSLWWLPVVPAGLSIKTRNKNQHFTKRKRKKFAENPYYNKICRSLFGVRWLGLWTTKKKLVN